MRVYSVYGLSIDIIITLKSAEKRLENDRALGENDRALGENDRAQSS